MAKELKIRITGDASGLKKATDDGEGILAGFGSKISAFSVATGNLLADGIKTGFSVVGGLIGDSIGGASDMAETVSKVGVLFGDAAKGVEQFAENSAVQFGQTKQQALDAAATFATFGKAAGLTGGDLAKFSTDFVGLSSDLASFNNTSPEQAIEAIGAALRGEAEPMRAYGVLLDDATLRQKALELGIVSTTKDALTPQQKVLAAQQAIWEQTGAAQGDFARTSDGLANKQRILAAQFTNLKTTIGQAFLPIVLDVVTLFSTKLMPVLEKFGPLVGKEIAGSIHALVSGFKNFQDGATTSGIAGFFEQVGIKARVMVEWFKEIAPRLLELGMAFKDRIAGAIDWFVTNMDTIKMVLTDIVPPVAAAVAAYMGFVKLQAAATAVRAFGVAFKAMSVAMLANPVGLVVAGIAALGVGLWVAYRRSETFRNAVNALASQVKQWWDGLVATFRADGLGAAMSYAWEGVKSAFGQFFEWMQSTALPWLGEKAAMLAGVLGGWVSEAAKYLQENLPVWLQAYAEWYLGTALPWVLGKLGELAVQLGEWVKQGAVYLRENLPIWLGDFAEWFAGTALPWLIDKGVEMATKLADWVEDSAVKLLRNLPGWIVKFEGWVRSDALPAMARFGFDAAMAIKDALLGALDFMNDMAGQIVSGLISGLWSQSGRLAREVQSFIASTIPGPVRDLLGLGGGGGELAGMSSQRASGSFTTQSLTPVTLSSSQFQPASITVPVSIDGRQVALATAPYSRQLQRMRA